MSRAPDRPRRPGLGRADDRARIPGCAPDSRTARLAVLAVACLIALAACDGDEPAASDPGDVLGTVSPPATGTDPSPPQPTTPADQPTAGASPTATPTPAATPTSGATAAPDPDAPVQVQVSVVATGLDAPWDLVFAGDGAVYLSLRDTGQVVRLADGRAGQVVATFEVDAASEGGLLGLAAAPAGDALYAYMTTATDNRVVRFRPGQAGTPEVILDGIPKARVHNGGRLAFGPDGMLYVATGDAGVPDRAQDPGSLAGKILRLTPDGAVPGDNPFPGSPVYALGLRNVQGLDWTAGGTLYASMFGPDVDDEINRIVPGGNYGWPEVSGQAGVAGFIDPVFVRQPPEASWSGLAVLTGGAIPQWEGDVFVAALRGRRLWRLRLGPDGAVADAEQLLVGELGRLRQVRQAPDGSVWVLTNNRDGRGDPGPDDDRIIRLGPPG